MLNRTNRTLSALLNRLNLGTRSLDLIASAFNGEPTLRIRHAHAVVSRDGMVGGPRRSHAHWHAETGDYRDSVLTSRGTATIRELRATRQGRVRRATPVLDAALATVR